MMAGAWSQMPFGEHKAQTVRLSPLNGRRRFSQWPHAEGRTRFRLWRNGEGETEINREARIEYMKFSQNQKTRPPSLVGVSGRDDSWNRYDAVLEETHLEFEVFGEFVVFARQQYLNARLVEAG